MKQNNISLLLILLLMQFCHANYKKNVLFIIVDDLRPALGCYGDSNAYTPNIDKLANISIQFVNAYAQQALCAPSRNSLLTSRRPDSLHLYDFYSYWRNTVGNFTTLPQYFKQNNYITASFGKVFHPGISSNWSDDNPYSWSYEPYHPSTQKYKDSPVCMDIKSGKYQSNLVCPVDVKYQPGGTLPDIQTLHATQKFINNMINNSINFFIAVGFHKPHIPFKYPKQFLEFHPIESISKPIPHDWNPTTPLVAWNTWKDLRKRDDIHNLNISFPLGIMPDDYSQIIRQSYYSAVTYIDDLIGQLLTTIKNKQLMDNTIIVFVGDHGWSLGEHAEWAKYSNFDVSLRVPLLIYDPEYTKNKKIISKELVELVDIFPTLCDLTNLPTPNICNKSETLCTEGHSLAPLIKQLTYKGKNAVFSQYPRPSKLPSQKTDEPRLNDIKIMGYTIKTDRYRYTEWVKFHNFTPYWNISYGIELYDHLIDPNETINLINRPGMDDIQRKLKHQLILGWKYATEEQEFIL